MVLCSDHNTTFFSLVLKLICHAATKVGGVTEDLQASVSGKIDLHTKDT